MHHRIPIKEEHKPFRHKLRIINSKFLPLIEKEIKKMYDAKVIVPLRFSKWVSNLVPNGFLKYVEKTGRFIVIYLDDVTVYSKSNEEHLLHLRHVFEKCKKIGNHTLK